MQVNLVLRLSRAAVWFIAVTAVGAAEQEIVLREHLHQNWTDKR